MKNRFDPTVRRLLMLVCALTLAGHSAFAASAVWDLAPATGDWNTAVNWTPDTVPNGPADTATFAVSGVTAISLSADTEVNLIAFNVGASAYTITTNPNVTLTISGTGISNSSLLTQNFVNSANGAAGRGSIVFENSATAGGMTSFTNIGGTDTTFPGGGRVTFFDNSNAGSATFVNNPGTVSGASGGIVSFFGLSSASSATITNNGAAVNGAVGGRTFISDSATAANVTITNNAGAVAGAGAGSTTFDSSASAGSGTFTNNGASGVGILPGVTEFFDTSTAADATFLNTASTGGGFAGGTSFNAMSDAGTALITNLGATAGGDNGGGAAFNGTATASSATINNNGGLGAAASGGGTFFTGGSNAGSATITNHGGTVAGAFGGFAFFTSASSASSATITNNGGAVGGALGGRITFEDGATAGNSNITNNGGAAAGTGGSTTFSEDATAGNSIITTNGGAVGGLTIFSALAEGETAQAITNGNGTFDISQISDGNMGIGSIAGSGLYFLGDNNFIVGANNLSTTVSGVIADGGAGGGTGGALTKIGTGTLILSGTNTYTGTTNINAGVLQVDGSINSTTFVNAGGTLAGSGTIVSASVINSGTVSPGTSPGTLTIGGGYTQTNTGTLRIEIGGLTLPQHDLLSVGTAASLNGTLQLVQFNNFTPMNGDQVTILTTTGGVTGTFSTVTDNFSGLIQPTVVYDPNDVRVVFVVGSFAGIGGLTPNQEAVAENLDDAANDPAAAALIGFLGLQPLENLPQAYDLIAPEELAAIYEVGFSQAMVQNNNLERRMDDIRAGSNGFCANVFVAPSGKDTKDGPQVYVPTENNRWGVFANGSGNFVNVGDDDFNAPGYEITSGNFTFGADYRVGDHFAVGINGGYASSQVDLVNGGNIDVDGGKAGIYATVFGKGFFGGRIYIDGAIGGGLNSYETLRIGLQNELVTGDTDGSEFNGMISYGSDWTFGCFNIGTWSTIQYTRVNIDEFTEIGSLAPLEIQDQSEDSLRSTSGIRASYDIKAGRAIFRPELRVAWQHEHGDRGYQVDSRLASGAGGIFRVHGPEVGRDAALVGAGFNLQWNNRFSTYVYYDGVLGRGNYDNNAVTGGLRVGF